MTEKQKIKEIMEQLYGELDAADQNVKDAGLWTDIAAMRSSKARAVVSRFADLALQMSDEGLSSDLIFLPAAMMFRVFEAIIKDSYAWHEAMDGLNISGKPN